MEIRGFVTNAEAYNNGRLIGEWVEFPCEEEKFSEVLNRIGVDESHDWFISDMESELSGLKDEVESCTLEEINDIANRITSNWDNDECAIAVCEVFGVDNVLNGSEVDYMFYPATNYEELGKELVDLLCVVFPTDLEYYFNYEEYGRDCAINMGGDFSSNGYFVERM